MADHASLHHEYLGEVAGAIKAKKDVDTAVQAVSTALGSYNQSCDAVAKLYRQLPPDGQKWIEAFLGLPKPITEITVAAPPPAQVSPNNEDVPALPNIHRDPKVDTGKIGKNG